MAVLRTTLDMIRSSGLLIFALLNLRLNGSQSVADLQWLPCQFVDEKVQMNEEGHIETQYIHREAVIQFGNDGEGPLYPTITFLITAFKVEMRRYFEGGEDSLNCEIRRHNTGGIFMRWPASGAQEHDVWFTCTLRHSKSTITTFLRHTPSAPVRGQGDSLQRLTVNDKDLLKTSAGMVILTRTPSAEVGFLTEPTLDCQFAVDHKQANLTVEWRLQRHGERSKLFSYSSRTGKSEGTGVSIKAIGAGNASFKLPPTRKTSEGTYICSVLIPPLYGTHDIPVTLSEQPRVSLNVGSTYSLTLGEDKKVVCDAEGYYPLDVTMEWLREPVGGSPTPVFLKNVLYSSHRVHQDGTYSLSAFFLLQPGLEDSGYKYTCRVSHKSLLTPIRKSFILSVTEPDSTLWYITVFVFIIVMLGILFWLLPQFIAARNAAKKRF
ncbi:tapasin-related protein-like [Triplophysa dalaica]|uniref:tapasin-related protein-like n=1 Tax=Triplophysa dalaica TaxID=1582913 RepID=UPI0024DFCB62|nr:tapasin-related protein-like [Triplophysa dalaica]